MTRLSRATAAAAVVAVVCTLNGGGCGGGPATTQPTSINQRQDAALRDPMGYKQQVGPGPADDDITHLDSNGLKRDLNNVFNP